MHRWEDIKDKSYTAAIDRGRREGAAWMAAYIALGTWAAWRDLDHRITRGDLDGLPRREK